MYYMMGRKKGLGTSLDNTACTSCQRAPGLLLQCCLNGSTCKNAAPILDGQWGLLM